MILNLHSVYEVKPTGDAEYDKREALRYCIWKPKAHLHILLTINSIKKELSRLERNKERRHAREKQKGIFRASAERDGGSPSATPALNEKPVGTTRKCANCGMAGHIKTNKKYCYQCYQIFSLCFLICCCY